MSPADTGRPDEDLYHLKWPKRDPVKVHHLLETSLFARSYQRPKTHGNNNRTALGGLFTFTRIGESRIQSAGAPLSFTHPGRFVIFLL